MNNLTKRLLLGSALGLIFGLLCHHGFVMSSGMPAEVKIFQNWSCDNVVMWITILDRFMIGCFVAMAGFITLHPILKFRVHPVLRGAKIGAMVSLLMALGLLVNPNEASWQGFWMIMVAGTIIGAVIDLIITKAAGEGKDLIVKK